MKLFFCSVATGIASFVISYFFVESKLSKFNDLVKHIEEYLNDKKNAYDSSIKEFKEYIGELKSELKETHQQIKELQKENDTLSGIFIAFKEKHHLEDKKQELPKIKNEVTNQALTNFV